MNERLHTLLIIAVEHANKVNNSSQVERRVVASRITGGMASMILN